MPPRSPAPTPSKATPLHIACLHQYPSCVNSLIFLGAPRCARPAREHPLVNCIATRKKADCTILLIRTGVDANLANLDGWTPLHYASEIPTQKFVGYSSPGANPSLTSSRGRLPEDASPCEESIRLLHEVRAGRKKNPGEHLSPPGSVPQQHTRM